MERGGAGEEGVGRREEPEREGVSIYPTIVYLPYLHFPHPTLARLVSVRIWAWLTHGGGCDTKQNTHTFRPQILHLH